MKCRGDACVSVEELTHSAREARDRIAAVENLIGTERYPIEERSDDLHCAAIAIENPNLLSARFDPFANFRLDLAWAVTWGDDFDGQIWRALPVTLRETRWRNALFADESDIRGANGVGVASDDASEFPDHITRSTVLRSAQGSDRAGLTSAVLASRWRHLDNHSIDELSPPAGWVFEELLGGQ
jgi:hypothetical protein